MAKNNKFTSINFNHIYEKNNTTSSNTNPPKNPAPSPSYAVASYSAVSSNKGHGRMIVLSRPTPKQVNPSQPASVQSQPQSQSQPPKQTQQSQDQPLSETGSDAISLRPLGHTGTVSSLPSSVLNHEKDKELPTPLISPKPDKFVPPHLRPGFVPREERAGPELVRSRDAAHRQQGYGGSPGRYGEDGRPKSGGYERRMRSGGSDVGIMGRPRSSGNRPNSSGWYVRLLHPALNGYETDLFPEDEDEAQFAIQWVLCGKFTCNIFCN